MGLALLIDQTVGKVNVLSLGMCLRGTEICWAVQGKGGESAACLRCMVSAEILPLAYSSKRCWVPAVCIAVKAGRGVVREP